MYNTCRNGRRDRDGDIICKEHGESICGVEPQWKCSEYRGPYEHKKPKPVKVAEIMSQALGYCKRHRKIVFDSCELCERRRKNDENMENNIE